MSEVEVFRSGARVVRLAPIPAGPWPDEVVVDGLPLALEDDSVRVSVRGEGEGPFPWPGDVRVILVLPEAGAPFVTPDEKEVLAARDEVQGMRARLERLGREELRLGRIEPRLAEPFANRPPRPAPAAAWRGTIGWVERRREELLEERLAAAEELRGAVERLARLERKRDEERSLRDARADGVSKAVALRLRDPGPTVPAALAVEYQVPGAFWVPSYAVRVARDGRAATLSVRALVGQRSGEPWSGVALTLSTADRLRETEVPELPSLRIGRREESPYRPAWRPLPGGTEELFAGFDAALAGRPAPGPPLALEPVPPPTFAPSPAPPPSPISPPMAAAPVAASAPAPAVSRGFFRAQALEETAARRAPAGKMAGSFSAPPDVAMDLGSELELTAGAAPCAEAMWDEEPADLGPAGGAALSVGAETLRYGELVLRGWDVTPGTRGKLERRAPVERAAGIPDAQKPAVRRRLAGAEELAGSVFRDLPDGACPVEESAGAFDARYVAEGPVDVPQDGRLHVVSLLSREAPARTLLVAVPREGPEAVRIATLSNPLRVPLLAGPADVYLEEELLVTAPLRTVPAGGELTVGLGVEERLKVARNVRYGEEAHGMLGGGTTLDHQVSIEVASRLPGPVDVEVRERVPLREETDRAVEVVVSDVSPPWSEFNQAPAAPIRGGKRWRFTLGPGEARTLSFRYRVRIDSRDELVGGNRREPA